MKEIDKSPFRVMGKRLVSSGKDSTSEVDVDFVPNRVVFYTTTEKEKEKLVKEDRGFESVEEIPTDCWFATGEMNGNLVMVGNVKDNVKLYMK